MLWNMLFGLCILGLVKFGDYISDDCPQAGYACPKICDVDHKHYPRKECKDAEGKRNIWKKAWKTEEKRQEKRQEKIERYKDAKTEQESEPDSTVVQSIE
jgi:hypothetical protein